MRDLAYKILYHIEIKDLFASQAIDEVLSEHPLEDKDRSLLTEIVYGTLRYEELINAILALLIDLKKTKKRILVLLRMSLYQMFFLDRVPDYALVSEAVEIAKRFKQNTFVNAVLRNAQRKRGEIEEKFLGANLEPAFFERFPKVIKDILVQEQGEKQSYEILKYFRSTPLTYLRVNSKKINDLTMQEKLKKLMGPLDLMPDAPYLKVRTFPALQRHPAYLQGWVSQQDFGSYLALRELLKGRWSHLFEKKISVLDYCAGHGGKAALISEFFENKVDYFVYDKDDEKLDELDENFARLGLSKVQRYQKGKKQSFDVIVLDAPCSGLGTLARKPEIKKRFKSDDLIRFSRTQLALVREVLPLLKPGALLIYIVCSFADLEKSKVIEEMEKQNCKLLLSGMTFSKEHQCDVFSYAYFEKS